ncbi:MAG: hypothetical protein K1X54_00970 [Flavobacteriales bacterium]|nr:hypothetical protein [Flavobacteriales bacterium]
MKSIYAILFALLVSVGCLKREVLPDEPKLVSQRFEIYQDSALLYLNFTDGDGNFGLEEGDSTGIFAECLRKYNLYAEYYEMQDGEWTYIEIDPCDGGPGDGDMPFYYRIPWAKPTGQNQTQDGEIKIKMDAWYLPSDYDTIKFVIKIVDRSMNESNVLEIGPYVKPQ